jgi:hypothetical protein
MTRMENPGGGRRPQEPDTGGSPPRSFGSRELIVVSKPEAGLRAAGPEIASATGAEVASLASLIASEGISLQPLFGASEERLRAEAAAAETETGKEMPDLSLYYRVEAPDERLDELAERLNESELIDGAYVKPAGEPPRGINDMVPALVDAPPATPDFTSRQGYLNAAPAGIDARFAWTQAGGRGAGVRIIDCEWGWRFTHEDLIQRSGGVVSGTSFTDDNHGTAVLGVIGGDVNTLGVTGICPDAILSASSFSLPTAVAIRNAADRLGPGDILLLEIHRPGPRATGVGQQGFICIEWWPDDFDAIRYAANKGVIVVEAAGNGAENLDDPIYNTRPPGFPASWTNPFNRANRDSGAVVVGAGAPPPGTHGRNWGPDRSRLDFSNYGSIVDAQGWGREVTTCGYGDLQGPPVPPDASRNLWYTDQFSGTSSASPIVVGALGCVQGVLRARGRVPLSPARARDLLRTTGSPQQDAPGRPRTQRIGNRPNLRQLIARATETATWVGVQFRGTIPAGQTQRWFTFNWPAHWHVIWTVVPTSPRPGAPQIAWSTRVERGSDSAITYWIDVTNVSPAAVDFEARYCVLGW